MYVNSQFSRVFLRLSLAGCSSASETDSPLRVSIEFVRLDSGFNTLLQQSPMRLTAITNQADLEQIWPSISTLPTPVLGDSTIVIAELGTQSGTGPEIMVESIVENTSFIEVFVTSFFGGPGCTEDSALSTPFDAVQFESIRQPIMFRERMEIVRCDAS